MVDEFNPTLFEDYPISLIDKIATKFLNQPRCLYKEYYSYVEYNKQDGFVEHIYACHKTQRIRFEYVEVMRRYESGEVWWHSLDYYSYGQNCGFHPYFESNKNSYYTPVWLMCSNCYKDKRPYTNFLQTAAELISQDESLKYCGYTMNNIIAPADYIGLYRKYPIAEMLAKLNLYHLVNERALKELTKNKGLCSYIFKNKDKLKYVKFNTIRQAYKLNVDPEDVRRAQAVRLSNSKELADCIRKKEIRNELKKHYTIDRIIDYIVELGYTRHSYEDYIEACCYLKLDLSDTKVAFPKDFKTMHDLYVSQMDFEKNKYIDEKMNEVATKMQFLNYSGKFCVLVAHSKQDLITEGDQNHNCVGRMKYDLKQADGKSIICFLRKPEAINESYVTMELDLKTKKVLQCYAMSNTKPDQEVLDFVNLVWLKSIKKKWKSTGGII